MNKKGQIAFVGGLITLSIAVLLVAYLFIPQAQTMSQTSTDTTLLDEHVYGTGTTTSAVDEQDTIISGSLTVVGLTVTNNYTVDYDAGVVVILNETASGNYTASYEYAGSQYLTDLGQRTLSAVLVLAGIIGLLFVVFRLFGLV